MGYKVIFVLNKQLSSEDIQDMTQNVSSESNDFNNELLFPPENDPDKEDFYMTRTEAEQIKEAFKDETFRKLFVEYVEEMQVNSH